MKIMKTNERLRPTTRSEALLCPPANQCCSKSDRWRLVKKVQLFCQTVLHLRNVFADVRVASFPQAFQVSVKDDVRVAQDHEGHRNPAPGPWRKWLHPVFASIKIVGGHGEGILQTMRD